MVNSEEREKPRRKMMAQFSDAKVGDRVWSIEFGWGRIVQIDKSNIPVCVKFENETPDSEYWYFDDGIRHTTYTIGIPTLFWDEVKIVVPERPPSYCSVCKRRMPTGLTLCGECREREDNGCWACRIFTDWEGKTLEPLSDARILLCILSKHHDEGCDKKGKPFTNKG